MKRALAVGALIIVASTSAAAHRVDEYLQAATLLVSSGRVELSLRLAPGVAVARMVLDSIDTNRDGVVSEAEGRGYGMQVLRDLELTLDKTPVLLHLDSWRASTVDEMLRGQGEIQLEFAAALPRGDSHRRMTFENRHRAPIAAFLVNALVPEGAIHIISQTRNYRQSVYTLEYEQADASATSVSFGALLRGLLLLAALAVVFGNTVVLRRRSRRETATSAADARA